MFRTKHLIIWFLSLCIAGVVVGCGSPNDGERIRTRGDRDGREKTRNSDDKKSDDTTKSENDDDKDTSSPDQTSSSSKIISLNSFDKALLDQIKDKAPMASESQSVMPKQEDVSSFLDAYKDGTVIKLGDLEKGTYSLSQILVKGSYKFKDNEETYKSILKLDLTTLDGNETYSSLTGDFWTTDLDYPGEDGILYSTKVSLGMEVTETKINTLGPEYLLTHLIRAKKDVSYFLGEINTGKDILSKVRSALEIARDSQDGSLTEMKGSQEVKHIVLLYLLGNGQLSVTYNIFGVEPAPSFIFLYDFKAAEPSSPAAPNETPLPEAPGTSDPDAGATGGEVDGLDNVGVEPGP